MSKYYIVYSKGDDYGHCRTELVRTTIQNAKEYYSHTEVLDTDAAVLRKYISFIDEAEERERDAEGRFYGTE